MDIDTILMNGGTIYGGYLRDILVGDNPKKIDVSLSPFYNYTNVQNHPLGEERDGILARMDAYYENSDFTCNLLERDKSGLNLRYIPDCFQNIKDPFGEVLKHIQDKHICVCCPDYITTNEAICLINRMKDMIKRGWKTTPDWCGLHIHGDMKTITTACGHVMPLCDLKRYLNTHMGQADCPHCGANPLVKGYIPYDIYNGTS